MALDHSNGTDRSDALHRRIVSAPVVHGGARAADSLAQLVQHCSENPKLAELGRLIAVPAVRNLLSGIFGASPYLTSLIERNPASLQCALAAVPERRFAELLEELDAAVDAADAMPEAMRALRFFKAEIALLVALSDLGGVWTVMTTARRLSEAADAAVAAAVRFLFRLAHEKGDWPAPGPDGYVVLAMGKHGAFELNYSSDIDLIVFYDPDRVRVRPGLEVQPFLVRLTRDLVRPSASAPSTATCSAPICACGPTRAPRRLPSPPTPPLTTTNPSARTGSAPPSSRRVPWPATSPRGKACCRISLPSSGANTSTSRPSPTSTP
jgi:glutamate-ammonia-ligase adenylyltransferase